jgi:hypothetical protein
MGDLITALFVAAMPADAYRGGRKKKSEGRIIGRYEK